MLVLVLALGVFQGLTLGVFQGCVLTVWGGWVESEGAHGNYVALYELLYELLKNVV